MYKFPDTDCRLPAAHLLTLLIIGAAGMMASCSGPKALFDYGQDDIVAPSEVTFNNRSEGAEAYAWDFGDGTTSSDSTPVHRYMRSGEYTVTLKATKGKKTNEMKETVEVNAPKSCLVELTTEQGRMLIELYNETPQHRDNFLKLAEEGYYDGLLFHRVIQGFMIQGGDPDSRDALQGQMLGSGGPGYQIPAEFDVNFIHVKGALAAARTGGPMNPEKKSSGSQFYIVQGGDVSDDLLDMVEARTGMHYSPDQREMYKQIGGTPHLDTEYTVFGRVIEGLETIDEIASVRTDGRDRPEDDVQMKVYVIK